MSSQGLGFGLAVIGNQSDFANPLKKVTGTQQLLSFRSPVFDAWKEQISGVTRDSSGVALGSCTVHLFRTTNDALVSVVTSDASGNFSFDNPGSGPFYMIAYLPGSPDVAGTTLNTLTAALV